MRLWSLHPKFLDAKGIVALWRESLLAQKVLQGRTKGYKHHPQLIRFRAHPNPVGSIGAYLLGIYEEAAKRAYNFDKSKIHHPSRRSRLFVTRGQMQYELRHLKRKLKVRDKAAYRRLKTGGRIVSHPIFKVVDGKVEKWEILKPI